MAEIRKKTIMEKARRFFNALYEGAKGIKFKGRDETVLNEKITSIEADERTRADLQAQLDLINERINGKYVELDDMLVDYRKGVEGHEDFGDDSPLYGAMGFVLKSERRSGLTKKKKNGGNG